MAVDRRRIVLLTVVGLALATNGLWLLPTEGETQYTYERAAVTVEGETVTYEGSGEFDGVNDLSAVGCEATDSGGRPCAFEAYLAREGPVNVSKGDFAHLEGATGEEFVALADGYYHRSRASVDEETLAYDVESVTAETLLAEISQQPRTSGDRFLGERVATGARETTLAGPDEVRGVGDVYDVDGSYYVVVVAERGPVDRVPIPLPRPLIGLVGGLVLAWVAYLLGRQQVGRIRKEGAMEWVRERF
jgi:hypothetical protein